MVTLSCTYWYRFVSAVFRSPIQVVFMQITSGDHRPMDNVFAYAMKPAVHTKRREFLREEQYFSKKMQFLL